MSSQRSPRKAKTLTALESTTTAERPRITPRNSLGDDAAGPIPKETPYNTLRQLASLVPKPTTPLRRASSVGPPSTRRSTRRTPGAIDRTPAGAVPQGSIRRANALTPHARAAFRENEIRRAAALTPGKDRRRSGRQQRETPRDALRALSRALAANSNPTEETPRTETQVGKQRQVIENRNDLEDGPEPVRPRLSMPLGEDDEDDSFLPPPQRSTAFVDEENLTQRSVEFPRRAASEQPGRRYLRGSFGSVRTSDRFGDLSELGAGITEGEAFDSSFFQQGPFDDEEGSILNEDPTLPRDAVSDQRSAYLNRSAGRLSSASGRASDVMSRGNLTDDTETTFVLTIPQRDSLAGGANDQSILEPEDDNEDEQERTRREDIAIEYSDEEDVEELDMDGDVTVHVPMTSTIDKSMLERKRSQRTKKALKMSRYGIQYSSLPPGVVKKLATTFLRTSGNSKAKISKDTLTAIMQATDWFFEQVSDNLGTYAEHAGRKTIDESDVFMLMGRQHQTSASTTPFALAQRYLPRELLQGIRMPPPSRIKRSRPLESVEEEEEEE